MMFANEVEHQIQRGGATRAGEHSLFGDEEIRHQACTGVAGREQFGELPVHGATLAIEQAGFGQQKGATADTAHLAAMACQTPQPAA